jgi:hypothetical protein
MKRNEKKMKMDIDAANAERNYAEKVASQMKKGLSNEIRKICEIGRVLRDDGLSSFAVNYYMSTDEDFISDVLDHYKGPKKREPSSSRASSHWPHTN